MKARELGQPLHAYDRALLEGDVVVRFARPQQQLLLLNGETLDLEPDLLMVCDERKPLGLAGIMGGEYSGIATTTRDVFLEGAFWNPAVIQGKMRRLGFASRVIEDVDPSAPTPDWMKTRLERSGIRSISAIVDVTNFVMLELGQPLHAYDRALLEGDVVVRFARPQEQLLLLNGETLDLELDLLMVCDERKPLGLAGIMGGEYSGIATRLITRGRVGDSETWRRRRRLCPGRPRQ